MNKLTKNTLKARKIGVLAQRYDLTQAKDLAEFCSIVEEIINED